MKLTIIIPVYKVEPYLDFCLKTVCRQEIDDCEIILVDDASPDRCGMLCEEWARKDSRIRVVHNTTNKGLSAARNKGLELAQGDYISFIDSDDYIAPCTLKNNLELLKQHPDADVVEFPVCVHHGADKTYKYIPGMQVKVDYAGWIRQKGYLHCYAWNKIYRKQLWEEVRFPEGRLFEDVFTIPIVLQKARRILRSDKGLYYYCSRNGSISNTLTHKSVTDLLQANLHLYNITSGQAGLSEKDKDDLYLCLCNPQIVQLQFGGPYCIPERKIPLYRALFTRRPLNCRMKAILKALSGKKYCGIVANTRQVLKK